MVRFGIQAPHEQINPTALLNDVIMMERYGVKKCWSSDHYMPWWHTGAISGAAWPWLGAALAKTDRIVLGTGGKAPSYVTILRLWRRFLLRLDTFPGRVFLGLGRGESLNEVPAGTTWPSNKEV